MEAEILLALFCVLLVVVLWSRRRGASSEKPPSENEARVPDSGASTSRGGGNRRMRRRAVGGASSSAAAPAAAADDDDDDGDHDEAEEGDEAGYYTAKVSKKKEQKKQDKEARKQAEAAARDHKREKQDKYGEQRRRRDEEREAEEQRKEEELRLKKERDEALAAAEFDKWKGSFSVDTEGASGENTEEGQSLINDFVEYIKKHKCVALEDLSAEFRLRTQDCINRIVSLEKMGRISGVMDDRGKFIYISLEEMKAVADYIKREGRVSISHLARKSNEFIDLEPKNDASLRLDDDGAPHPIAVA